MTTPASTDHAPSAVSRSSTHRPPWWAIATHAPAGAEAGAGTRRGVGQCLRDLAEPASRVQERACVRPGRGPHPAEHRARAAGRHPPPGHVAVQFVRAHTPQLPGVGAVEGPQHRGAEPDPDLLREGVGPGMAERPGQGVHPRPRRERRRQVPHHVPGLQREPHPVALQPDPAVAGTDLQVGAQQRPQGVQHHRRRVGMQPVAAVVHPDARHVEAGGQAPQVRGRLHQLHLQAAPGAAPGRGQAGRATADHHHLGRAGGHPSPSGTASSACTASPAAKARATPPRWRTTTRSPRPNRGNDGRRTRSGRPSQCSR